MSENVLKQFDFDDELITVQIINFINLLIAYF